MTMKKPTLLILAAGMGKRYGGLKQIDSVGPHGEMIIDYSIYDALKAGCQKIVFVIRKDIAVPFEKKFAERYKNLAELQYVYQELDQHLDGFTLTAEREKPWGTGHAVLSASRVIDEPFVVINADDFYGPDVYKLVLNYLKSGAASETTGYAMAGYVLGNTLSDFGQVSRGVCRHNDSMFLKEVQEHTGIEKRPGGACFKDGSGRVHRLSGNEIVSMNFWGFQPEIFDFFKKQFQEFLRLNGNDPTGEFYLPAVIDYLVKAGIIRVKILPTDNVWFGITYQQDRQRVVAKIRELVANGVYPQRLF